MLNGSVNRSHLLSVSHLRVFRYFISLFRLGLGPARLGSIERLLLGIASGPSTVRRTDSPIVGVRYSSLGVSLQNTLLHCPASTWTVTIATKCILNFIISNFSQTFCAKCLFRSLDHNPSCPLCRQALPRFTLLQDQPCNKVIWAISKHHYTLLPCRIPRFSFVKTIMYLVTKAFPDVYEARRAAIEEEEHQEGLDTPVFVCQLSFPGMPVFLNFFEPRFKLMLRRCLETEYPCFGMIPLPNQSAPSYRSPSHINRTAPTHEYGTMLEIRKVQMLPDGQCLVEAWGTHRFRILKKGELDGYCIAKVEQVDDLEGMEEDEVMALDTMPSSSQPQGTAGSSTSPGISGSSSSSAESTSTGTVSHGQTPTSDGGPPVPLPRPPSLHGPTNQDLMNVCNEFLAQLENGTPWVIERLNQMYVPKPDDPGLFSFWMALV